MVLRSKFWAGFCCRTTTMWRTPCWNWCLRQQLHGFHAAMKTLLHVGYLSSCAATHSWYLITTYLYDRLGSSFHLQRNLLIHVALCIAHLPFLQPTEHLPSLLPAKVRHCSSLCCNGCGLFGQVRSWQLLCVSKCILFDIPFQRRSTRAVYESLDGVQFNYSL